MNILVTGSHGLVGSALVPFLGANGHRVTRLVRARPRLEKGEVFWAPAEGSIDAASLEELDAVVNLAGDNIASARWSAEKKAKIRDSRVKGTSLLCESLARLRKPPKVLVSASAVGYYGDRGAEILDETSPPGFGFLAQVCQEWEAATEPAVRSGIRVVKLRIGVVLSPVGGALARMLPAFRMGVGGKLGTGKQYMSWIAIDDLIHVILHALNTTNLRGPVNAVSPKPVTNAEFTKTLGRVLGRHTIFPMPGLAARIVFGQIADEVLLASNRVEPTKLLETRYVFRSTELEPALRYLLQKA